MGTCRRSPMALSAGSKSCRMMSRCACAGGQSDCGTADHLPARQQMVVLVSQKCVAVPGSHQGDCVELMDADAVLQIEIVQETYWFLTCPSTPQAVLGNHADDMYH